MRTNGRRSNPTRRRVLTIFALVCYCAPLGLGVTNPRPATAQSGVFSPAVRQGLQFWKDEKYLESIETLRNAVKDPALAHSDRVLALRLIAQCSVRVGDESGAIDAFHNLLTIEPAWQPDPDILLPDEVALFETKAKPTWKTPEAKKKSFWKSRWMLGAGGLVTAGVIAAVAGGGGGQSSDGGGRTPLPPLPGHP